MLSIRSASFFALLFCLVWASGQLHASGVVCPVCGQVIDDGTVLCPNDGTDLKLLGKPPEANGDTEKTAAPANKSGSDAGVSAGEPPETAFSTGGYKRHDEAGERRVVEEKSSDGYSDRRSRLPKDSRTAAPQKKKRHSATVETSNVEAEDDSGFFADYEKKRRYIWLSRKNAAQVSAQSEEEAARIRAQLLRSLAAPIASLGGRVFFMGEEDHLGPVSGAEIDFQLARYHLRAGFSTFLGIRALEARNELVFLESLSIGAQIPSRFSPFFIAKGGLGMIATERFETDQAYLLTAFGAEAGLDAWVHPWLSITPSFGFMRCTVNNAYWNSFTFKLAVGF